MATVAFHTLGCKLNYAESSSLARMLADKGYRQVNFGQHADMCVLNTCSVTDAADKECLRLVRKIKREQPAAFVVVVGCLAQTRYDELCNMPEIDLVLAGDDKFSLPDRLDDFQTIAVTQHHCERSAFHPAFSYEGRTRAFLKVQDGCGYSCSYCIIPRARGGSRSAQIAQILAQAQQLAQKGVHEIVLTGVNIGQFGAERTRGGELFTLLRTLDTETTVARLRISSIEPNLLHTDMIAFVAGSRAFMPHFHLPLQSGCDKILRLMRRRYNTSLYRERLQTIQQFMPHACVGVDVIVGFPGETEEDFQQTYDFIDSLPVGYLHVFTYSERGGTVAAQMPDPVPLAERKERNARLRTLSMKKSAAFRAKFAGQKRPVLFEGSHGATHSWTEGYTDNYIRVKTPFRPELVHQIVDWQL